MVFTLITKLEHGGLSHHHQCKKKDVLRKLVYHWKDHNSHAIPSPEIFFSIDCNHVVNLLQKSPSFVEVLLNLYSTPTSQSMPNTTIIY